MYNKNQNKLEFIIRNTENRIQSTEYKMKFTEYRMQNTDYGIKNKDYRTHYLAYRKDNTSQTETCAHTKWVVFIHINMSCITLYFSLYGGTVLM